MNFIITFNVISTQKHEDKDEENNAASNSKQQQQKKSGQIGMSGSEWQ